MITLRNIVLRRGPQVLLNDVNLTIYMRQRVGIIGANGSGKSSLFVMLLNHLPADKGELELPKQWVIAHVAQETPTYTGSALDYVLDGDQKLRELQQKLEHAEAQNAGELIATLHGHLQEIDAYTAPARAARLLDGLGFNTEEQQKPVNEFSGGWRVRLNLAQALMCRSDILLLDEPTNHLDLDAVVWLESWLKSYPGTLLLISHDREFLDQVVDHIVHVSQQQLKLYAGNYSAFETQRAAHILLQQAAYDKQQKHLAHLQSFVDRFRAKASKAKQAQSRLKAIARMELIQVVHTDSALEFSFKEPLKCPIPLLNLNSASIAYGSKRVLSNLNLSIMPKDRIALLGPNGAGKTSLIRLLAGELRAANGSREAGQGLKIGYFAQHQVECLELGESPLSHMRQLAPTEKEQALRTFLGSFGFSGTRVLEKVDHFSGGEKSRLALALLVWQQPNLLLLDEPTNHLDLDMRHSLSMALQAYEGAMILVSHDRFLVRSTVDKLMLVANGELSDFAGDLDEYEQWLLGFRKRQDVPRKTPRVQEGKEKRLLVQEIKKVDAELDRLQKELAKIENVLSQVEIYEIANKTKLQEQLQKKEKIEQELQMTESRWLQVSHELEHYDEEKKNVG